MHIVIVCDTGYVDGGAPKVAIASARGLADAGFPVSYICASGPAAPELDHPNIRFHCLNIASVWKTSNPLSAAGKGIWNSAARAALAQILGTLPRDELMVHFHQWTKSLSPGILATPAELGLPAIVSLHDYFLSCPNGAYYRFPAGIPCDRVPMSASCLTTRCDSRNSLHKAVRVVRQLATTKALMRAGASLNLLNVSPFAKAVIDRFIPARHRRYTLRSPIEVARGTPALVADNKQFVFVGRMTAEKGVRQLAAAAHRAGLPVTFVGSGPLLKEIQSSPGPIRCTGWVEAQAVDAIMKQARALVFPSTWYETGGLVVLEALARGVPVIVSRTTAAADFVADGENGYLVDPADPEALKARMQALADDATAARMGQNAYDRYWANPQDIAAHVSGLVAVYRAVLSEHAKPAMEAS